MSHTRASLPNVSHSYNFITFIVGFVAAEFGAEKGGQLGGHRL